MSGYGAPDASVYSASAKQWLPAKVCRVEGSQVTVVYQHSGVELEKTLELGHAQLRLHHRPLCPQQLRCRARNPEHLTCFAHVFDVDYMQSS